MRERPVETYFAVKQCRDILGDWVDAQVILHEMESDVLFGADRNKVVEVIVEIVQGLMVRQSRLTESDARRYVADCLRKQNLDDSYQTINRILDYFYDARTGALSKSPQQKDLENMGHFQKPSGN